MSSTAGPLPCDIQPVENETRDRIITGLVTVVPFVALGFAAWQVWGSALHWSDVFLFLGMYFFTGLGITVGFHRHLTHRAFKTEGWLHGLLAILGSAAIEGPVISWVADHRKHHAFSDRRATRTAPTSTTATAGAAPCAASSTPTWAGSSSTPSAATRSASRRTCSRTRSSSWVDRTFIFWAIVGLLLPFFLGWSIGGTLFAGLTGLLWGGLVRVFVLHHFTYSINSLCHVFGSRDFETDDQSRNLALIAIPTLGEAFHNSHHAFPTSATHGLGRWSDRHLGPGDRRPGEGRPGLGRGPRLPRAPGRQGGLERPSSARSGRCLAASYQSIQPSQACGQRHGPVRASAWTATSSPM